MSDLIISNRPEKVLHGWEQSNIDAEHVLKILTVENQKILDPFVGAGTTAVAAIKLNRKFLGIDIDPKVLDFVRANIQKSRTYDQKKNYPIRDG
jgi:DNA modification methylase